jgi:hypothetical protein
MLCRGRIQKGGFFRLFVCGLALPSGPRRTACGRRRGVRIQFALQRKTRQDKSDSLDSLRTIHGTSRIPQGEGGYASWGQTNNLLLLEHLGLAGVKTEDEIAKNERNGLWPTNLQRGF